VRRGCRDGGVLFGPPEKVKESATRLQPSLFKWASNVVTGLRKQIQDTCEQSYDSQF
jgi:hypothetical protein